jgi:cellulose synthase/poly-beta-1,6-N-acetylglucosamine synthase-like glycosyltransferase
MIATILAAAIIVFAALLYYVYDGYLRCLRLLVRRPRRHGRVARADPAVDDTDGLTGDGEFVPVTVVIAVHNEAHQIVERVRNVIDQDYPRHLVEVVVASDGSNDGLQRVVDEQFGQQVRVVHADDRVGKSAIQNEAVESVHSSILVFSDADTRFQPGFLREITAPFADPVVGAVQAHLLFVSADAAPGVDGQDRYWRAELEIRQLEAELGILAVASGACIAVRRELWQPLDPQVGEDCMIPLDVVSASKIVAYADRAVAHELAERELDDVVATRARMTVRNWQGTWSRPALLNPLSHPGYAYALWSHKLLRWLSPIWLIGLTTASVALAVVAPGPLPAAPAAVLTTFYALAAIGRVAHHRGRRVPICSTVHAFVLANVGFLLGLARAARGVRISRYR